MNLPSNKISSLFVIVVLIVVGTISFEIISNKKLEVKDDSVDLEVKTLTLRKNTESSSIDSDNDGLLDWEETLRATDPTNRDTDGDGTSDGDEVREGRDPATPGPDDTLAKIQEKKAQELGVVYEDFVEGSLTDEVAVAFLNSYAQLKSSDTASKYNQTQLIENIVNQADEATQTADRYTVLDTKPFVGDTERIKNYGNTFASTHIDFLTDLGELNNTDPEQYVDAIVKRYAQYADAVINLEVPQDVVSSHLQIANNLYNVSVALDEINNAKKDPIKGLLAIKKYNAAAASQPNMFLNIARFFRENDIIFNDNDAGKFWLNI